MVNEKNGKNAPFEKKKHSDKSIFNNKKEKLKKEIFKKNLLKNMDKVEFFDANKI